MFFSLLIIYVFINSVIALSLQTVSSASAGQTVAVNWTRTSKDPSTFFISLRKADGLPQSPTEVDSDNADSGQVGISIASSEPAGTYLFEGFNVSQDLTQSVSPLASSNSFDLDSTVTTSSLHSSSSTSQSSSSSSSASQTHSSSSVSQAPDLIFASISTETTTTSSTADNPPSPPPTSSPSPPPATQSTPAPSSSSSTGNNGTVITPATGAIASPSYILTLPQSQGTSDPQKLKSGILAGVVIGSVLVFMLLLSCFWVLVRRYNRKHRRSSSFYADMIPRSRVYTPSFTTNHIPSLNFNAPSPSHAESEEPEEDEEEQARMDEKESFSDYPTKLTEESHSSHEVTFTSLFITPQQLEILPPLQSPAAFPVLPTVVTAPPPSPPQDVVSLIDRPRPKRSSSHLSVPGVRKSSNPQRKKRRKMSVSAEILALKRKMVELKEKSLQDSRIFSEMRERFDFLEESTTDSGH